MIEVIGEPGSSEYEAALLVRDALARAWRGIETSPPEEEHVKIASSVKLSGQKVSDIDVVVAGLFRTRRYVVPRSNAKDMEGNSIVGAKVRVRSFIVAVEVKDHSSGAMRIEAGGVKVKYGDGWKSATDQNDAQGHALKEHFRDTTGSSPWVYRCVALLGIPELPRVRGIPQPPAGAVPFSFDALQFLMAAASVLGIRKINGEHAISSGSDEVMEKVLADGLFQELRPSSLDRRRMDRIASRPQVARELANLFGSQRVHLRGHGGTGKTILLLQAAYEAFVERGTRSLVLTYNTALAADIQRTIALMGIPGDGDAGGITVRTVMSFMYSWLGHLGLGKDGEIDLRSYDADCREASDYFASGAVGPQEVEAIKKAHPFEFGFDAILVDEAQDWPQPEADLLARLYGGNAIALADGFSQLVRGRATDWKSSVVGEPKDGERNLRDGLRMKASLAKFANALADEVGLQWNVAPSAEAPGGRVIVRIGRYSEMEALQRDVLASAIKAGNMPVDLLHCVPPSEVTASGDKRSSLLAGAFRRNGWMAWDAVDEATRRTFPRSSDALRVVQYESCRGLEGWITVLDGLDESWQLARRGVGGLSNGLLPVEPAEAAAWLWIMIPLTRPIDTLVITLRDRRSRLGQVIEGLGERLPDIVDYER
ncbi:MULTISPECIES: DNA/RNA helicase [unclassified Rhizobium]|uniref:DNA/RNA helicase n=1 Tax=unclassified Rhizobium TaxID=2613769 RepID=UPI001B33129E|nr:MULTISPECIES: DNA/RNA helicase [unclassified Rhizobium]MBX5256882.1 DNA/RNA helicase [Rhizobium sp. NLR16b]MBX5262974.1 DNA/RNA helicase [Rhizobium sp. NLR16a]MBX5311539.1 DNA/RNA helicase [Rhizobium sp. NLR11b]QTU95937.1 DNA/RNA helicase [Rhizobium sp. NLR16a]